jgi:hypothetical protein
LEVILLFAADEGDEVEELDDGRIAFDEDNLVGNFVNQSQIEVAVVVEIEEQGAGSGLRGVKTPQKGECSRLAALLAAIVHEEIPIAKEAGGHPIQVAVAVYVA